MCVESKNYTWCCHSSVCISPYKCQWSNIKDRCCCHHFIKGVISMGHSNYISPKNSHTVSNVDNLNTVHHMPVMFQSLNIFSVENTHTDRRCIQPSDTCRSGRGHSETRPFRLRWSLCQGRHRCPQTGSNDPKTTRTDPFVFLAGIASGEWACKILIFCEIT